MKRLQRQVLEELSLKAYGTKTRYKKMMERGIPMDLKDEEGRKYRGLQRFDEEEIQSVMAEEIEEKKKQAEVRAAKKAAAEAELANKSVEVKSET